MTGWRDGLGPWTPVIEGDRLYGRGGADDGYAAFASLAGDRGGAGARACPHARCVVLIEASEESGSPDLPAHLDALARPHRHAEPGAVPRLRAASTTSGCGSPRRCAASSPARCASTILTRGRALRRGQRRRAVDVPHHPPAARPDRGRRAPGGSCCPSCTSRSPPTAAARPRRPAPSSTSSERLPVRRRRRGRWPTTRPSSCSPAPGDPTLSITGVDGIPPVASAGNVLRPRTALQLSLRIPPTCDHERALDGRRPRR